MTSRRAGYDYEYLWALYLKCKGYGAKVTSKSGDEGADVIAIKDYKRIAYQCKLHSKPIGRKAIYEAHAGKDAYQCSKAIVVTNNTFTKQAIETAKKLSVGLLPKKTPESLIETCIQSYKEGMISSEDELFLRLPIAIQKAIIHGNKNMLENMNVNDVKERDKKVYDEEDKIGEESVREKYDGFLLKQKTYESQKRDGYSFGEDHGDLVFEIDNGEKMSKVCPLCGRKFWEHSVKCPICKCGLVDLGENKIVERNRAYTDSDVKPEKKKAKNRKLLYCCIGVVGFMYISLFFMAMYFWHEKTSYTEKVQVAVSSKDLKGKYYADVVKTLQDAGFENIELIEDADLVFGLLKQEGEVEKVSINGKLSFEENEYFPKDSKIKISYHTFKPEFKSSKDDTNDSPEVEKTEFVEYDILQNLFLELSVDTTMESVDSFISENNLEFTKEEYNGEPKEYIYKIAYKPRVALQRYADSGDSVEICFSRYDGSLLYAEYFNDSAFMSALLYNYGTFWDFRESEPDNSYSGYYYSKPGKYDGLIIEYANGLSTQTSYHPCSNAEEAILSIIYYFSKHQKSTGSDNMITEDNTISFQNLENNLSVEDILTAENHPKYMDSIVNAYKAWGNLETGMTMYNYPYYEYRQNDSTIVSMEDRFGNGKITKILLRLESSSKTYSLADALLIVEDYFPARENAQYYNFVESYYVQDLKNPEEHEKRYVIHYQLNDEAHQLRYEDKIDCVYNMYIYIWTDSNDVSIIRAISFDNDFPNTLIHLKLNGKEKVMWDYILEQ